MADPSAALTSAPALFAALSPWDWAVPAGVVLVAALIGLVCWLRPYWPLRALLWAVAHSVYWVRVVGRSNVPARGGALLVCNHVSYVDWLLLLATQRRFIRFVVWAGWTKKWGLRHLLLGRLHPHRRRLGAVRHRQVPARRQRRLGSRRAGVHLRRGPIHADRLHAAVPARLRASPQALQGARRPGLPRPGLGEHLQLLRRPHLLENAIGGPVSRHRGLRPAAARRHEGGRRAPGDPEAVGRLRRGARRPARPGPPPLRSHSQPALVPAVPERQHVQGEGASLRGDACRRHVPGAGAAADAGRGADGRRLDAAERRRGRRQHRAGPARQDVGQPQLHGGNAVRQLGPAPVRLQARPHLEALHAPRQAGAGAGRRAGVPRRPDEDHYEGPADAPARSSRSC